jgi:hypothetical protein
MELCDVPRELAVRETWRKQVWVAHRFLSDISGSVASRAKGDMLAFNPEQTGPATTDQCSSAFGTWVTNLLAEHCALFSLLER